MAIRHAIIMAAGRGSRMAPLTDCVPKPMAPFGDSTLIARALENIRNRVLFIHVTVGYKKAMLAQHVIEHGVASVFNTEGQGNAWWIFNTLLCRLNEPTYVLTCDNVVELDFDLLEENYESLGNPPCMLVPVEPVEGLEGDFIFHKEHTVIELNRRKRSDIYCSGIQILNPARVCDLMEPCDDFYSVWGSLIDQKQLRSSSVYPKKWFSVDTLNQLKVLNSTR
ncbi:MAG: NTP transferase domain-containing protein [Acidobacteria bacterium]|nr:NTP transferase domain-containing protein [Acidobacteriota bacterium]